MNTISSKDPQVQSLHAQVAILRKLATDELGEGIWGLAKEPTASFSHEEIVFLFARVFQALGFDTIQEIRTQYPDCIATKSGELKHIEFEPLLSSFQSHLSKDDLSICDYIICWDDDLPLDHHLKSVLRENGIEVIELKEIYRKTRIKRKPPTSIEYREKDIRRLTEKQLKILSAFVRTGKSFLTKQQLAEATGLVGRALGGALKGFPEQAETRDWLLRKTPKGWQFNDKYRRMVERVVNEFSIR